MKIEILWTFPAILDFWDHLDGETTSKIQNQIGICFKFENSATEVSKFEFPALRIFLGILGPLTIAKFRRHLSRPVTFLCFE